MVNDNVENKYQRNRLGFAETMKFVHEEKAGNDYSLGSDLHVIHEAEENPKAFLKFMEGAMQTLDSGNDYMDEDKDLEFALDNCQRLKDPQFIDMTTGRVAICDRDMGKSNSDPCDATRHRFRSSCGVCNNLEHKYFI